MILQICPLCSSPGLSVENTVIKNFTSINVDNRDKYFTCCNENCDVAYFSETEKILNKELNSPLWYKDKSMDTYICYCSRLSRSDILKAVKNGAETIENVQKMTTKNRTGFCKSENPVGACCRNVFLYTIEEAKK